MKNDLLFVLYCKLKDSSCSMAFFLVLFAHSHDSIYVAAYDMKDYSDRRGCYPPKTAVICFIL